MTHCKCCGFPVQDGRQFCPVCEGSVTPDAILADGTRLYLKTTDKPCWEQLKLYEELMKEGLADVTRIPKAP